MNLGNCLENVRAKTPLVHSITNYVTVNDCANILLAAGASPIMADDINDALEITAICGALNINIGTLNERTVKAMLACGLRSKELGHHIVLDPVGAGASKLRAKTALRIVQEVKPAVIRGNISEIKNLFGDFGKGNGVDASSHDKVTGENLNSTIELARSLAEKYDCVVAITGAIDIVSSARKTYIIRNGHPMMSKVTGTGCMLSALIAAYISVNEDALGAVVEAVISMGVCGEIAHARLGKLDGNATYRNYVIDAFYNLTSRQIEQGAKFEVR